MANHLVLFFVPFYTAYGLVLDSEIPIPELSSTSAPSPTISLRLGRVPFSSAISDLGRVLYKPVSATEVIVHYDRIGTALVRNGSEILLESAENADPLAVRLFVLQQVFGVALLQRGYLVLHAGAAAIKGRAVAFAGPSGQGKSTIVAALNRAGFPILTDDVLAIDMSDPGKPLAWPGLTQLKLTEETRAQFAPTVVAEKSIRDRGSKKLCDVKGGKIMKAIPVGAIYLLESTPTLTFTPVPKARAAVELVRHTYGSRLLQAIGVSQQHFEQSVALARQIPIIILGRPRDLSLLPKIVERLKQQLPW
jgi:hypothetical protein